MNNLLRNFTFLFHSILLQHTLYQKVFIPVGWHCRWIPVQLLNSAVKQEMQKSQPYPWDKANVHWFSGKQNHLRSLWKSSWRLLPLEAEDGSIPFPFNLYFPLSQNLVHILQPPTSLLCLTLLPSVWVLLVSFNCPQKPPRHNWVNYHSLETYCPGCNASICSLQGSSSLLLQFSASVTVPARKLVTRLFKLSKHKTKRGKKLISMTASIGIVLVYAQLCSFAFYKIVYLASPLAFLLWYNRRKFCTTMHLWNLAHTEKITSWRFISITLRSAFLFSQGSPMILEWKMVAFYTFILQQFTQTLI